MLYVIILLCALTAIGAVSNVEKSTGVKFPDKINGLDLLGVGVRKKGPLKVYALGLYSTPPPPTPLKSLFKTLLSSPKSTLLLSLTFSSVTGPKMASALSSSLSTRYPSPSKVTELSSVITSGASSSKIGKGTLFQFDCSPDSVSVVINGKEAGEVEGKGIGKAFCEIYLDEKGVSKGLKEDLKENWGE
ncbi:hypothetical protein TrST_g13734 [Triparma strigata]|uniref:Chalcone isomerase domain-containing protein n=1 Tax=Triparma strigata TaxID=1606541 RepID=A0A9W7BRB6_9STRA|nr:hypothetical protein TrST_g13734 [Triparma strigata]